MPPIVDGMEVHLTPDQEAFIRHAIESGRLQGPEEAVQQALTLWEEQERRRMEILTAVDRAEASLAFRQGYVLTEQSMQELANDVKHRGRTRLAEQSPRR